MLIPIKAQAVLKKQLHISWIPMLIALGWTIISYFFSKEKDWTFVTGLKDFITALFFVMWFVGQYLRTSKEINDATSYSTIQTGIADLRLAIAKLEKFPPPDSRITIAGPKNDMLENAKKAIESGFVLAGLMQAGVAFEQAVIEKAHELQIDKNEKTTIAQLLNHFRHHYEQGKVQEFFAVWKLRNQLVHLTKAAAQELEKNPKLINYFEWAINELQNSGGGRFRESSYHE